MVYNRDVNSQDIDEERASKINAAGLINSTLENLWRDCYSLMSRGDYVRWNIKLDSIWAILGGDVKDPDEEDGPFKKLADINKQLYEQGSLKSKIGSGFGEVPNPNNAVQYQILLKKALFLRKLQNDQGKGTAYIRKDDYDM